MVTKELATKELVTKELIEGLGVADVVDAMVSLVRVRVSPRALDDRVITTGSRKAAGIKP